MEKIKLKDRETDKNQLFPGIQQENIYKWIISVGLIILIFFLVDLFFIKDTLLTPLEELHSTSRPQKDIKTGIYYLTDNKTGKTYTLDENRNLVFYDTITGTVAPLGNESGKIKLTSRGLLCLHQPVSPLYAFYLPKISFRLLLPVLLIVLFIFILFKFLKIPNDDKPGIKLFYLFMFSILIKASFAWLRHDFNQMGIELIRYRGESILFDVPGISGIWEFLRTYPENMVKLSANGSHYPPGFALLLKLIASAINCNTMQNMKDNINIIGWIVIVIGSISVYPLYLTAKELFNRKTALIAVLIFIFVPNIIIYGAVSLDSIFTMLALWPLYFLIKAGQKQEYVNSILAGLLLGIALFFSFSGIPLGLLMVLFVLFQMAQSKENLLKYLKISAVMGIALFAFYIFIYYLSGFNMIQCFFNAKALEGGFIEKIISRYHQKTLSDLAFYITFGNYLAFAIYAGFHNVAIFLHAVKRAVENGIKKLDSPKIFCISVLLLIAIIGTSFVYHMETERIWQFITAFIAIIAAGELAEIKPYSLLRRVLLLMLGISAGLTVILESLLFTLW